MIELGDAGLSRAEYGRIVAGERVTVSGGLLERLGSVRAEMLAHVATGVPAYGITTGLGRLARVRLDTDDQATLQRSLLLARAAGIGQPLPGDVVRGTMTLRLTGFLHGVAGVTPELCTLLVRLLDEGWSPVVPAGPYGAAGEIGPLAHLFQTLTGHGTVLVDGAAVDAAEALRRLGMEPYEPRAKEGLALINGSPFATALGIRLAGRARALIGSATVTAALSVALTRAGARALSPRVGALQGDVWATHVQEQLRGLLADEDVWDERPQAPVSARVVPQVHGAAHRALAGLDEILDARLRGTTDAPVFIGEGEEAGLYPTGAFHAVDVSLALEALAIACCHVVNLLEKRLHRLLSADFSGLPDQLTTRPGVQAGVVALHKTVVGLTAQARALAAPASVSALDTSDGQEDVQALTFLVAERVGALLDALETALACELVALRQGAHLAREPVAGEELAWVVATLAEAIAPVEDDRTLSADIAAALALLRRDALAPAG